ncbi:metallophosphoesterase [Thermomicrobiaceae bacterium CFH 74404]|uniref:Metallophosphoesterase n=1 Tax=Thermalbibacter longus TaxID=2951981 RepID=A0AA41WCA5_9BACT|nr:metallophosphoesterase [Thermalbibacter longus]MCM8750529.1 metallophosphoesterase [Thermalbibacter longus]
MQRSRRFRSKPALIALLLTLLAPACGVPTDTPSTPVQLPGFETPASRDSSTPSTEGAPGLQGKVEQADPVLFAVGDIASCKSEGDEATAALLDGQPGLIAALGDTVYESGKPEEYAQCFAPAWGRHKERIRPAVGNHEYKTPGASGYFAYFGELAGEPGKGYYSYDLGRWHIVVLNSNCKQVGGCHADSPQAEWLRSDLAAHPTQCAVAYWHHPRFSSGQHGDFRSMQAIWEILYEYGVDVVLTGHDHDYERFAPLNDQGQVDPERGIRSFVVGTGGRSLRPFAEIHPASEVRDHQTYGVLKLTLRPDSYEWQFIPAAGGTFTDAGQGTCHS